MTAAVPTVRYVVWVLVWSPILKWRGTGKGLAAHLEVPLPYLLYRVNARFQEEIRGLKDIQGALSPSSMTSPNQKVDILAQAEKPILGTRTGLNSKLSSSRLSTPRDVRARLTSLSNNSPSRPKKVISSSTITVQSIGRAPGVIRPQSPLSSDDGCLSAEDETILKEEEAERNAEEQEIVDRKLEELTRLINTDTLGLVRTRRTRRSLDRERSATPSSSSKSNSTSNANSVVASFRGDSLSSVRSERSENQSLSSVSSPQGSMPEIPSPQSDSQPHSPIYQSGQNASPEKSASPAAVSPRSALSHSHNRRHTQLLSEHESSGASSFSDLSGKCHRRLLSSTIDNFTRR